MENKEQCYSLDESNYMSYEDMMHELQYSHNPGESVEVWEADKEIYQHKDFINIEVLIDSMQTLAVDECGEIAEEYLNELTFPQKYELERNIAEWFNKNAKLNFYGFENQRKIMVVVE